MAADEQEAFQARVWRAATAAAVRGVCLYVIVGVGFRLLHEMSRDFGRYGIQLPTAARGPIGLSEWLDTHPTLFAAVVALIACGDAAVSYALDRPGRRWGRELWTGFLFATQTGLLLALIVGVTQPPMKMLDGVTRTRDVLDQARWEAERELSGRWELVAVERDGKATAAGPDDPPAVAFEPPAVPPDTARTVASRFRWEVAGRAAVYGEYLAAPNGRLTVQVYFLGTEVTGPRLGMYRQAGDRLTVVLGALNEVRLTPDGLDTAGTEFTKYEFRRAAGGWDDVRP